MLLAEAYSAAVMEAMAVGGSSVGKVEVVLGVAAFSYVAQYLQQLNQRASHQLLAC